jgi:hypothetical protein
MCRRSVETLRSTAAAASGSVRALSDRGRFRDTGPPPSGRW